MLLDPITLERFWAKVVKRSPSECWSWEGALMPNGKGIFSLRRRTGIKWTNSSAHRVAFTIAYGRVPADWLLYHSCNDRTCVNPDHGFLVWDHRRGPVPSDPPPGPRPPEKSLRTARKASLLAAAEATRSMQTAAGVGLDAQEASEARRVARREEKAALGRAGVAKSRAKRGRWGDARLRRLGDERDD